MRTLGRYVDLRRLAAGAALLAAVFLPLYFVALRGEADPLVEGARLLETPPVEGRTLRVGLETGQLAPDFVVSRPDGSRLRLSELRGRPVLINFWASWCGSCLSEMPVIKAVQEDRGVDSFAVVALNAGETRRQAQRFIDFLQAPFLYGLDPDLTVSDAYGVFGLPLSVFLDASGVIQAVYRGHADRERLEAYVAAAARAEPPGELPVVLRLITPIPRERLLVVSREGAGRVVFASRSLRCDHAYCADSAVDALRALAGVQELRLDRTSPEARLFVRFDATAVSESAVVEALAGALSATPDPVYQRDLEVRFGG